MRRIGETPPERPVPVPLPLRSLLPLFRPYRAALPVIVGLGLLASLSECVGIGLFLPLLRGLGPEGGTAPPGGAAGPLAAVERLLAGLTPEARLRAIAGGILAAITLKAALSYGAALYARWLDARVGHDLRTTLYGRLLRAEYEAVERLDAGRLLHALTTETWRASEAVVVFIHLLIQACALAVYGALLLLLSWPLTLATGAFMLGVALVARRFTTRVRGYGHDVSALSATLTGHAVEAVEGHREIRAFGREADEERRFEAVSGRVRHALTRLHATSDAVRPLYEVLAGALVVAVLVVALRDPGRLPATLVFIFVLFRLQPVVMWLDRHRASLVALAPAVEAATRTLADAPAVAPGTRPFGGLGDGLRFDDVGYRYAGADRPALDGLAFAIPAGRTTAVVGPSGAGKSTLVKLLLRLYAPTEGRLLADGVPLGELDLAAWRARVAFVGQDVYLFNASVRDNIAYGRPGATDAEVEAAARLADADTFIGALPEGYATVVGDRGVRLSGGQRQRITLARALVRDPDLLILDEATNALDSQSERLIQTALDRFARGRTVVVIAHRLATVERADHVVVLDGGRVAETGTPAELRAHGGLFAHLHRLQAMALPADTP